MAIYIPVINDIIETRFVCFDSNAPPQVSINVLYWKVLNVFNGGVNTLAIAQWFDVLVQAAYKALIANATQYRGVLCSKVYPTPRTPPSPTAANAGAGTAGADMAPTQVAGLLKWQTDKAGRAFRGRIYVPFVAQADVSTIGNLTAGYETRLQALGNLLIATQQPTVGAAFTTLVPVLFHKKPFGKPPAGQFSSDQITGNVASPLIATQRRRGNYGRVNTISPV